MSQSSLRRAHNLGPSGWKATCRPAIQFAMHAWTRWLGPEMHLELLIEEPSMEALLEELLPRVVPGHTFGLHVHQGKPDLLNKVEQRLRAYARMTWTDLRVVVIVDRDLDDCFALKKRLTDACD